MKFWQRCLILLGSACVTLTLYFTILDDSLLGSSHQPLPRRPHPWSLKFAKLSIDHDPDTCNFLLSHQAQSNISTYDLFQNSSFNLISDGSYEIPTPPPDYPRYDDPSLSPLTVILMPHSHVDPGWLKTIDEYYVDQTKHILINMVNKLTQYPNMSFVWAETVYFSMWWNELEDAVKVHVRRLIRRGQLEIVLGGWVVPDEATTHYVSVIDQLLEGHQWLWENLGVKPQNSWSIDPFGYSGTMPYLWKQAGMQNMVIQRVHQAMKGALISRHSLEFRWRQTWDPKGISDILCHVMPYKLYSIKFTCGPNRFQCLLFDFRHVPNEMSESRAMNITSSNIEQQAKVLYEQYRRKAYLYNYNTLLVPVGDDFRYDREIEWDQQYTNYARLMNYMNSRKDWKINVRFGTLKDYFQQMQAVESMQKYDNSKRAFPVLTGDFFPYSDQNLEYWTGYYSTRPFDKKFSRDVQSSLRAADLLNTLVYVYYKKWGKKTREKFFKLSSLLQEAHRNLNLFMHHDAITGTEKEFVVEDYERRLQEAYNNTQTVNRQAVQWLLSKGHIESPLAFSPEEVRAKFNEGPVKQTIRILDTGTRVVMVNPVAQHRQEMVHLYVNSDKIVVKNDLLDIIACQINPVWDDMEVVKEGVYELVFQVELPPFAIVPYMIFYHGFIDDINVFPAKITIINTQELAVPPSTHFYVNKPQKERTYPIMIENKEIKVFVDPENGQLQEIVNKRTGNRTRINLEFLSYKSQGSGAYLFYPSGSAEKAFHNIPIIRVIEGPLISRVEVLYEPYLCHHITLYQQPELQTKAVHIRNSLNIKLLKDREIIMRMRTSIRNKNNIYFTDQNGFQLIRRKTNPKVRIEANYYPLTTTAMLEDDHRRFTLLAGQSHGVAGLQQGWLEVMLDRQLLYDDNRGLGEPVIDIKTAISDFVLLPELRHGALPSGRSQYALPSLQATVINDFLQQPVVMFYSLIETDAFQRNVEPLSAALPCDMTVVNFRSLATADFAFNGTSLILHRRAYDCSFPSFGLQCSTRDPSLSFSILLKDFPVKLIRQTTLTHLFNKNLVKPNLPLGLSPMEIAAYLITW